MRIPFVVVQSLGERTHTILQLDSSHLHTYSTIIWLCDALSNTKTIKYQQIKRDRRKKKSKERFAFFFVPIELA